MKIGENRQNRRAILGPDKLLPLCENRGQNPAYELPTSRSQGRLLCFAIKEV